ncbi:ATP-binding protein [Thermomonas flagellata]|uniref:ATP-binding protein n=1 Tax=Thermomonas flagellata TaxID=2888524 RepID=UPI001F043A8B|nr:ATP-binding protein [Thermomonas flagellata]
MLTAVLGGGAAAGLGLLAGLTLQGRRLRQAQARALAPLLAAAQDDDTACAPAPGTPAALAELAQRIVEWRRRARDMQAQQERMAVEMLHLIQQGEGALRARQRMLDATGHDLRQPLQRMQLALARLPPPPDPEAEAALASLREGIADIAGVLDGLLLLARCEAGAVQPQAADCTLEPLFAALVHRHAAAAARAGIGLHWRAGRFAVHTDPALLADLLERLLDNALRATPPGGRVLLAARRHADGVRIEVRDSGIGIAPVHQPRVFDEFFQIGNPERDPRRGYGLGLAIAARLAALLGTRVELDSALHRGSRFWLALPRADAQATRPHALVYDRDPARAAALAGLLASWGHAAQACTSPAQLQAALAGGEARPALLLCALEDADDPAWLLLDQERRHRPAPQMVVLCRQPRPELLARCARLGARLGPLPPAPARLRALLASSPAVPACAP